jgi:hypothetical protein
MNMPSFRRLLGVALPALLVACSSDKASGPTTPSFLLGTSTNHQIGIVVNSTGRALTLFQLGSPTTQRTIALGSSSAITPVGVSIRGHLAVVPLGDAASVALVDFDQMAITRFYLFASGNTTGQAFADDTTILAANTGNGYVGRVTTTQTSDSITQTVAVAPAPTDIEVTGGRAFVLSANLDVNSNPLGNGVVTAINPQTLAVLGTVTTSGTNTSAGAVGPDGYLYVLNTGNYSTPGTMDVINPSTLAIVNTITNANMVGPGAIQFDSTAGLAFISGYYFGTLIYNVASQTFVPATPICVLAAGSCVGVFDARADASGNVYQDTFGTSSNGGEVYVFKAGSYTLQDSVSVGQGPTALRIETF